MLSNTATFPPGLMGYMVTHLGHDSQAEAGSILFAAWPQPLAVHAGIGIDLQLGD
ncbi:MAG: hypothetical protein ACTXOO_01790 [Sodalis sp. (in: enterobacteria)]